MVLGKKNRQSKYRTFEAIFVALVERSDMVIVMDPRNGAPRVATVKRLSESARKDSDSVMALCGLPRRPEPNAPALDDVLVRVSAAKVPWQDLPGAPQPRAPEVESRRGYIRRSARHVHWLSVCLIACYNNEWSYSNRLAILSVERCVRRRRPGSNDSAPRRSA